MTAAETSRRSMSSSDPRSQTVTPRLQPPMDSATAKTTTAAPQTKASPLHSLPKMTLPSFQELPLSNPTPRSQADRQRRQTRAWSYLRHYQTTPQQRDPRSHERPTPNPSPEPSVLQRLKRPHPIRHTNNNGNTAFFPLLGPASHAARLHTTLPPTIHDCVFGNSSLLPRLDEERYHD
jgi:hypothetical protein